MESNPENIEHKIVLLPGDRLVITTEKSLYFYYRSEIIPINDRSIEINL